MIDPLHHLEQALGELSAGAGPAAALGEIVEHARLAVGADAALAAGLVDGAAMPLVSAGPIAAAVLDAVDAAVAAGARVFRQGPGDGQVAAEPITAGGQVVGVLAVAGDKLRLDLLTSFGGVVAAALAGRQDRSPTGVVHVAETLAALYGDPDRSSVLVHLFDAAEELFGAHRGLYVQLGEPGATIVHDRGIDRDSVRDVADLPELAARVTGTGVSVLDLTDPIVARLSDGTEHGVGLALHALGRPVGWLLLLVDEAPSPELRGLLTAFARHAALALRVADLVSTVSQAEERVASVVHSMPNPVVVVDEQGCFATINGAAAETFGLSPSFERGNLVTGRLGHESLERMLVDGEAGEVRLVTSSPERVWRATVRRVGAPGGRSIGRVLLLEDVTAESETEQMKHDLVAVVGHELRTPLTVIKSSARSLERAGAEAAPETRVRALDALGRGVARLEALVDDLLLVAAVDDDNPRLHFVDTDVAALLDELAGGRVRVERPGSLPRLPLDADKIRAVLAHLVDNAQKFSDGDVTVAATVDDEGIDVTVADHGVGIYSGDIPHLFDRFRQLDSSSTRAHGGTGIGLYLCRRFIEVHHGRIWCESRLGVGSRFTFRLPLRPPVIRGETADLDTAGR